MAFGRNIRYGASIYYDLCLNITKTEYYINILLLMFCLVPSMFSIKALFASPVSNKVIDRCSMHQKNAYEEFSLIIDVKHAKLNNKITLRVPYKYFCKNIYKIL